MASVVLDEEAFCDPHKQRKTLQDLKNPSPPFHSTLIRLHIRLPRYIPLMKIAGRPHLNLIVKLYRPYRRIQDGKPYPPRQFHCTCLE